MGFLDSLICRLYILETGYLFWYLAPSNIKLYKGDSMANLSNANMTTISFQAKFDGDAVKEHSMDVHELAPAMLALGDLCRQANYIMNGDRAKVNLLVKANIEQGSFQIEFEFVQSFFNQFQSLLAAADVKSAKDILVWIQILVPPGGALGLFGLLKWLRGRKPAAITEIKDIHETGNVTLQVEGDNNQITVNNNVYLMSQDRKILTAAGKVVDPLQKPGYEKLEFKDNEGAVSELSKSDARDISASCFTTDDEIEPQILKARLITYRPTLDEDAKSWSFKLFNKPVTVDISSTNIAKQMIQRGGVRLGDSYIVNLEVTETRGRDGRIILRYKALEVINFQAGPDQMDLIEAVIPSIEEKDGDES